jgi:hypothetical protein
LFVDGGEGAKQEAVDVGEDGGTAWGDAALLEGEGEVPEMGVDVRGGFLFGEVLAEEGREVALLRQSNGSFGGLSPFLRQGKAAFGGLSAFGGG